MFLNKREWEATQNYGMTAQHCYFIPFDKNDKKSTDRNHSSRMQLLNGMWEFCAHECVEDCELEEELPDKITVPSCVQVEGYDANQYTNIHYPFPYNPPYIEKDIPTFHYRRNIRIESEKNVRLIFEGVDAAFYVFLNGSLLGFSQITHKNTEFDLTGFARKGENVLDVIVLKWCAGSYLEDQDKWRFSGIIHDVYLLYRDDECVEDYKIESSLEGENGVVQFTLLKGCGCEVTLHGVTKSVALGETVDFRIPNPRLWSAEIPSLYDMEISAGDERIYERIGIREVCIKDGVFLLNGKPIKLLGVNRHEFYPGKGASISIEDIRNDLLLMKKLHVNAIRTSHYPNVPEFYKLCDEYGFYVMNETDIEAHGVCTIDGTHDLALFNTIAEAPLFEEAIVERVLTMYERDKNRPCVILFSLGNESGYGASFERAARKLKALDTRPIQYEGHINVEGQDIYYNDALDVVSRMYPSPEWVKNFLEDKRETRPLVLCEYCHAMGNGPGNFKEYWEILRSSDRYMGGFVWEWADHGMPGKDGYLYGGDFGETIHDSNFCIDGIVTSDRKLKGGTMEMSAVYQPIAISYAEGKLTVKNRYFFKAFDGTMEQVIKVNGAVLLEKKEELILTPGEEKAWTIEVPESGFAGLYLTFTEKDGTISNGFVCLRERETYELRPEKQVTYEEGTKKICYESGDISFCVEKKSGNLISLKKNGQELLREPMRVSVMRAPVDNEMYVSSKLREIGAYEAVPRVHITKMENGFCAKGKMLCDVRRSVLDYEIFYQVVEGGMRITLDYSIPDYVKSLPCVGLRFAIDGECNMLRYLGYGGRESYVDMNSGSRDVWEETVEEQYFHYVKPQESGNHTQTDWVELEDVLRIDSVDPFDFSAIPYSAEQLMKAKHDFELQETGKVYMFVGRQEGMGSNSCGPGVDEKYLVPRKEKFVYELTLKPEVPKR